MEETFGIVRAHELCLPDYITGLRKPISFGRPNFDELFAEWAKKHQHQRVGVFYCGPSPLGQILRQQCDLRSGGTSRFVFHEECF